MSSELSKHSRKSRESKSKSQDWPEVPEIEKIQEHNPEILAMKILESGRQIEANKLKNADVRRDANNRMMSFNKAQAKSTPHFPAAYSSASVNHSTTPTNSNSSEGALMKVAFFEDRIKNIITTALNEDNKNPSYPRNTTDSWSSAKNNVSSNSNFTNSDVDNVGLMNGEVAGGKCNLPDYTQVSPAKLALRRHLSQEKVSPQSSSSNYIGTRTIGDLVSGEIERTLEISNQSIINTVVPMCLGSKNNSTLTKNDFTEALIQKSLTNSCNSSSNSNNSNNTTAGNGSMNKPNDISNAHNSQYNNPKNSRSSVLYSTNSASQSVPYSPKYTTVHLPRAEMKPYHESYFTDMKPAKEEPVEGYVIYSLCVNLLSSNRKERWGRGCETRADTKALLSILCDEGRFSFQRKARVIFK